MPRGVRRRIAVLAMAGTGGLALLGGTAVAAGSAREPAPQVRITPSGQRGPTPVQQSQPEPPQGPQGPRLP